MIPKVGDVVLYGGNDLPIDEVFVIELSPSGGLFLGARREFINSNVMDGTPRPHPIRGAFSDTPRWMITSRIIEWLSQ